MVPSDPWPPHSDRQREGVGEWQVRQTEGAFCFTFFLIHCCLQNTKVRLVEQDANWSAVVNYTGKQAKEK